MVEIPILQAEEYVMDAEQLALLQKEAMEAENAVIDDAEEDI